MKHRSPKSSYGIALAVSAALMASLQGSHRLYACQDVNSKGSSLDAALIAASSPFEGDARTVEALLEKGANVNAQDKKGWTALMEACSWGGGVEIVKVLLSHGADVNTRNNEEGTALYNAAVFGEFGIVKLLLARGANVNAQNDRGFTPLFGAAMGGHIDVVKALLAKGADPTVKTIRGGRTAGSAAREVGYEYTAQLIENHGRQTSGVGQAATSGTRLTFEGIPREVLPNGNTPTTRVQLVLNDGTFMNGSLVTANAEMVTTSDGTATTQTRRDRIRALRLTSLDTMKIRNTMADIMETVFREGRTTPAFIHLKDGREIKGYILPDTTGTFTEMYDRATLQVNSNGTMMILKRTDVKYVEFLE